MQLPRTSYSIFTKFLDYMTFEMKRILLAENHPLIILGFESLLKSCLQDIDVNVTSDFNETLSLLDSKSFDLLIIDIAIPGADRMDMVDLIRSKQADLPILICSDYEEKLYGIPFLKAGASGFIPKTAPIEEFKFALDLVVRNRIYMSPSLFESSFEQLVNPQKSENMMDLLSEKEYEIARLLVKGLSVKSIGEMVNISSPAVSNHKSKVFKKLGISNIIELNTYFDQSASS
jgi:two-component system invasion response regulator UvrY